MLITRQEKKDKEIITVVRKKIGALSYIFHDLGILTKTTFCHAANCWKYIIPVSLFVVLLPDPNTTPTNTVMQLQVFKVLFIQ